MLDEETLRSMLPGHFGQQGKKELPTAQEHNEASQEEEKEEKAPVPDTLDVLKEYAGLPLTRSIQLKDHTLSLIHI